MQYIGTQTSIHTTVHFSNGYNSCNRFLSGADVREVNLKALTGGIVHTKLWVVDQKHLYLGSANMDWRSLSQVKRRRKCILTVSIYVWTDHETTRSMFSGYFKCPFELG